MGATTNLWDTNVANAAIMAEHCMKLGAVILGPKDKPTVGFAPPKAPDGR